MLKKLFVLSLFFSCLYAKTEALFDGKEYHFNSKEQFDAAKKTLDGITFNGSENVLDIGCGSGEITAMIASHLEEGSIEGIDISPSMVTFAKEQFPNLNFLVRDVTKMDFDEKYDVVVSFSTLQWVPDQLNALKKIERALKPGGRVVIDIPQGLPFAMKHAVNKVTKSPKWAKYFNAYEPQWKFFEQEEYQDLLSLARLDAKQLDSIPTNVVFPNQEAFTAFISQWFPYQEPLNTKQRKEFMKEIVSTYLEEFPKGKNNEVYFLIRRLRVEALKGK